MLERNRKSLIGIFIGFAILMMCTVACNARTESSQTEETSPTEVLSERYKDIVHSTFQSKARQHKADTRYLILVDYSIPSNDYRLFIWDAEQDCIVEKFWCTHGFGGGSTPDRPVFSNTPGSNCSSLGWYLVDRGVGVSGKYGYDYHAVEGLDASNSNARRREILIHSWSSVDRDYEAQIDHPMKLDMRCAGCFTTTDEGFKTIDRYVKSRQKRMLLVAID